MERKYTRREVGAYTLGLGLAGSTMSTLSSRVSAAGTEYETDTAGVPQPANASELQTALSDAPDRSLVECQSGAIYRLDRTIEIPDRVTLDARGATIDADHGGPAIALGNRSLMYGGHIDLGSGGGVGVVNRTSGRHKWNTAPNGLTITADPGTGARGHIVEIYDGGRNFFHAPVVATDGVDVPLELAARNNGGFTTSIDTRLVASDFETAIRVDAQGGNVSHCYAVCDLTPGPRTKRVLEYDCSVGRRFMTEGRIGDASNYDELLWIKSTKDNRVGAHSMLSYEGYSSRQNPGLVRDDTGVDDSHVIDFSQ